MRCAQKSTSGGNDVAVQQFCLFLAAAVGCTGMYRGATRRNARFSHQLFVFGVSLPASAFGWFLAASFVDHLLLVEVQRRKRGDARVHNEWSVRLSKMEPEGMKMKYLGALGGLGAARWFQDLQKGGPVS